MASTTTTLSAVIASTAARVERGEDSMLGRPQGSGLPTKFIFQKPAFLWFDQRPNFNYRIIAIEIEEVRRAEDLDRAFAALVAPLVFNWVYEHPVLVLAAAMLLPLPEMPIPETP